MNDFETLDKTLKFIESHGNKGVSSKNLSGYLDCPSERFLAILRDRNFVKEMEDFGDDRRFRITDKGLAFEGFLVESERKREQEQREKELHKSTLDANRAQEEAVKVAKKANIIAWIGLGTSILAAIISAISFYISLQ